MPKLAAEVRRVAGRGDVVRAELTVPTTESRSGFSILSGPSEPLEPGEYEVSLDSGELWRVILEELRPNGDGGQVMFIRGGRRLGPHTFDHV